MHYSALSGATCSPEKWICAADRNPCLCLQTRRMRQSQGLGVRRATPVLRVLAWTR